MTIKPEGIPSELVLELQLNETEISEVLNVCIEAGVVSPPAHCIKHDDGYVIDPGNERKIRIWPGRPERPHHEHWRGQTE